MVAKIVVDTSVFISALLGPAGPSRALVRRCLLYDLQPLMGDTLFLEYESVLKREEILEQCPLSSTEIEEIVAAFMSVSRWTPIYYIWRPNLRDEADNHLIELAIAGNASMIATNNTKDFQNTDLLFPSVKILKPEDILRSL